MIRGVTESGFAFSLPESAADNMELVDALAACTDSDPLAVSRVCRLFLGDTVRRQLYDHLRTADGRVPVSAVVAALTEILAAFGEKGKN